jgi:hypothetical protein
MTILPLALILHYPYGCHPERALSEAKDESKDMLFSDRALSHGAICNLATPVPSRLFAANDTLKPRRRYA